MIRRFIALGLSTFVLSIGLNTKLTVSSGVNQSIAKIEIQENKAEANISQYIQALAKYKRIIETKKIPRNTVMASLGWCADDSTMGRAYAVKHGLVYFNTVGDYLWFDRN